MTPRYDLNAIVARVRSEFLEMPGFAVTIPQASRLWNTPAEVAAAVLGTLMGHRFLIRLGDGSFVRASEGPLEPEKIRN
jgi:hypothetical protein